MNKHKKTTRIPEEDMLKVNPLLYIKKKENVKLWEERIFEIFPIHNKKTREFLREREKSGTIKKLSFWKRKINTKHPTQATGALFEINWKYYFDKSIEACCRVYWLDHPNIYGLEKQKRLVIETIQKRVSELEKTKEIIMTHRSLGLLEEDRIELWRIIKILKKEGLIQINDVNIKHNQINLISSLEMNISLTKKFEKEIIKIHQSLDEKRKNVFKKTKNIISIILAKPKDKYSNKYILIINGVEFGEINCAKKYWAEFLEIIEKGYTPYNKPLYDYFNHRKENPIYSRSNLDITKIIIESEKLLKISKKIECEIIGHNAYAMRVKADKITKTNA